MQSSTRQVGRVTVVALSCRAETEADFTQPLGALIAGGHRWIVLDCRELEYLNSAALRSLVALTKQLKSQAGVLALAALSEAVCDLFDISGISAMVSVFPSVDAAVDAM